jgi:hypothetical protein
LKWSVQASRLEEWPLRAAAGYKRMGMTT